MRLLVTALVVSVVAVTSVSSAFATVKGQQIQIPNNTTLMCDQALYHKCLTGKTIREPSGLNNIEEISVTEYAKRSGFSKVLKSYEFISAYSGKRMICIEVE